MAPNDEVLAIGNLRYCGIPAQSAGQLNDIVAVGFSDVKVGFRYSHAPSVATLTVCEDVANSLTPLPSMPTCTRLGRLVPPAVPVPDEPSAQQDALRLRIDNHLGVDRVAYARVATPGNELQSVRTSGAQTFFQSFLIALAVSRSNGPVAARRQVSASSLVR